MSNYWKFFSVSKKTLFTFIVGVAFSAGLAYATNPTNPFIPSDRILDPDCVPTDTNCYVALNTWSLSGNAGTDSGSTFIGTTDANPLSIKTNGTQRIRIGSDGNMVLGGGLGTQTVGGTNSFILGNATLATASATSNGTGSFIIGNVADGTAVSSGAGSVLIGQFGNTSGGTQGVTTVSGTGASFMGWNSTGTANATGSGAMVQGLISSSGGGIMEATASGSLVRGRAQNGGIGRAAGPGSMVSGFFSTFSGNASLMETNSTANGAHVFGGVENGSQMLGYGAGAMVLGYTGNHGILRAGSASTMYHGAIVLGYGWGVGASIVNEADGALAGGTSDTGTLTYNNGTGSLVWGQNVRNGISGGAATNYSFVFGLNISNTTPNTFSVGWNNVALKVSATGVDIGNSVMTGSVARFQNNTATCDINPTTASLACSSDYNLKKNIVTIADQSAFVLTSSTGPVVGTTALDKIRTLTPVLYNWNSEDDGATKHPGFIAQEVEQVFPDLVATDAQTGYKSMNYTGLIPYTVSALQELSLTVEGIRGLDEQASFVGRLRNWLGSVSNGIGLLYAKVIEANRIQTNELCVSDTTGAQTCVTKAQLDALLLGQHTQALPVQDTENTPPEESVPIAAPTEETQGTESEQIDTQATNTPKAEESSTPSL